MMSKEYMRTCMGFCGAELDSESSEVDVLKDGDLICHYCRDAVIAEAEKVEDSHA